MKEKNKGGKIPNKVWLLISFLVAMVLWYLLSLNPKNSKKLPEYYRYFKFYKNND